MTELITITGLIATDPKLQQTKDGLNFFSFRLASNSRKFVVSKNEWVTSGTNWFTVTCFRQLAINASESLSKGDRVVVTGKLKIRDWDNGERSGTSVEIDVDSIGHDLNFGTSELSRVVMRPEEEEVEEDSESELQPA
jgi:single-strand DNA-binding protein